MTVRDGPPSGCSCWSGLHWGQFPRSWQLRTRPGPHRRTVTATWPDVAAVAIKIEMQQNISQNISVNVSVATWNIAAINNNPFEYWVTYPDTTYNDFMLRVEQIIADETYREVREVFTDSMFSELLEELRAFDIVDLESLEAHWTNDLSRRSAIQGFLKDKGIGEKRLTSMPDRVTNTIHLTDGTKLTRPTVINAYNKSSLQSVDSSVDTSLYRVDLLFLMSFTAQQISSPLFAFPDMM